MQRVVDLLGSFPTVAFTALLAFCLAWWLIGMVVGGLSDGGDGPDGPGGHDGQDGLKGQNGHGPDQHEGRMPWFDLGAVPLSLALLVLSFGAWACSLALSSLVESAGAEGAFRWVLLGLIAVVAVVVGMVLTTGFARIADPLFTPELAPERERAVGSICRVRTPPSADRGRAGDAVVLTGAMARSIISIRADIQPPPAPGDVLLILAYDASTESFLVTPADEALHP